MRHAICRDCREPIIVEEVGRKIHHPGTTRVLGCRIECDGSGVVATADEIREGLEHDLRVRSQKLARMQSSGYASPAAILRVAGEVRELSEELALVLVSRDGVADGRTA